MRGFGLTREDEQLVEAAKEIIGRLYVENRHVVSAAIRTHEGDVVTAVHLETYVGRMAVCAETIALGKAISMGYRNFSTVVAVYHAGSEMGIHVVSPCGMCRELLLDYSPKISVIVPHAGGAVKCALRELLPLKYARAPTDKKRI